MRNDNRTAYLALGANLGDRECTMRLAIEVMNRHPSIKIDLASGVASLYESDAVGGPPDQGPYLNSVVRISTTLVPHELLDVVLSIEADLGRTRHERWEARTIDIDMLLFDDLIMTDERLTLPHPRLHERSFMLEPLAELAGDLIHPVLGLSISDLAQRVRDAFPGPRTTRISSPTWP